MGEGECKRVDRMYERAEYVMSPAAEHIDVVWGVLVHASPQNGTLESFSSSPNDNPETQYRD